MSPSQVSAGGVPAGELSAVPAGKRQMSPQASVGCVPADERLVSPQVKVKESKEVLVSIMGVTRAHGCVPRR